VAFEHPLAGFQLVKGSIEPGESPEAAAVREMQEEAGVAVHAVRSLGTLEPVEGQRWSLTLCEALHPLADRWVHRTADDGGHEFRFFWQGLSAPLSAQWALPYQAVVAYLRAVSSNISFDTDTHRQCAGQLRR
jgi:8-oxo-dGTP pyrophosphatase MutT (NUDIX family)